MARRSPPKLILTTPFSHAKALAAMLLCTLLWSLGGVVSRQLLVHDSFETTFWRSVFAGLTILVWLFWQGPHHSWRRVRQGGSVLLLSGAMWALMFTCFMTALTMTKVANVLITQCLGPVFTALLASWLFKKPLGQRTWVAVALASVGILVMYAGDVSAMRGQELWGVVLALGVPVGAAINWVVLQRQQQDVDLTGAVLVGAVISALITALPAAPLDMPAHDVAWLAFLGVFQLGVPCALVMHVAKALKATEASLLSLMEVIFGIALTWAFASEAAGLATLLGGGLVLSALVYNELR